MADLFWSLFFGGGMLYFGIAWICGLMLIVWWPVMAFRAMRDVRKIRLQFERLNDILERQGSHPFVGKPNGRGDSEYVPGSDAWTRTGPLNLR